MFGLSYSDGSRLTGVIFFFGYCSGTSEHFQQKTHISFFEKIIM